MAGADTAVALFVFVPGDGHYRVKAGEDPIEKMRRLGGVNVLQRDPKTKDLKLFYKP